MLDAAKGSDFVGDHAGVDPDHAIFQCFTDPPAAADVAAVKICREAELGVVGQLHGFCLGLETENRRHRTESFFTRHFHA